MNAAEQYEFLVFLLPAFVLLELGARKLNLPPAAAFIFWGDGPCPAAWGANLRSGPGSRSADLFAAVADDGAYFTVWQEFKENLSGIVLLALGAVVFTTLCVGVAAKWLVPDLPSRLDAYDQRAVQSGRSDIPS